MPLRILAPLGPLALFALAPVLAAQQEEHRGLRVRPEDGDAQDFWSEEDIFEGDLVGLYAKLGEQGLSPSLYLITDSSRPFGGGVRHRRTERVLFGAALEVDLEEAAGLPDTILFAEFYSHAGRDGSADVGDIQAFSNIDEEHVAQLAELWLERSFADGDLRVKVGKLDANSEFAYVEAGFDFLHSSAGYSPTVFALPTYPDPAVSLNVFTRPAEGWMVGLGLYNAQDGGAVSGRRGMTAEFDETFLIGQVDRTWGNGEGRFALGLWHHTGDFARFDGGTDSGAEGVYALVEQRLTRERPGDPEDEQGLRVFLQWGSANGALNPFERHLGAGLLYTGLVPHRDSWRTGLYLSHADLTNEPAALLGGSELAIELFQEVKLMPSLTLKPDVQFIVDPSGSDAIDDAWVATLRVELSL